MDHQHFERRLSVRSRQIWEREGRPSGRDQDFLARARDEIETEWRKVLHGETSDVVPPQLPISQPPVRHA